MQTTNASARNEIRTIGLTSFKHYPRMSEETLAFHATLLINGKKAGVAKNDGHGGPSYVQLIDPSMMQPLVAYARALPPEQTKYGSLEMNLDFLLSTLAAREAEKVEAEKTEKKHQKKAAQVRAMGMTYWVITYPDSYVSGYNRPETIEAAISGALGKYGAHGSVKRYL